MSARRRLSPDARRAELLEVGARLFARHPYREVLMDDVAAEAEVSRALLYKYFPSKRDLFVAVYQQAADALLDQTELDQDTPLDQQLRAGLDAHLDYFVAHRTTVVAANRDLAGDPVVQAVITGELDELRRRLLAVVPVPPEQLAQLSATVRAWLVFVQVISVEWLEQPACTREQLRETCVGSLLGALAAGAGGAS